MPNLSEEFNDGSERLEKERERNKTEGVGR